MDTLVLKGITYPGKHGVYEREKIEGNTFEVDVRFTLSLKKAATTDDLTHTVNYVRAQELIAGIMLGPSVNLIETLVHNIGTTLFDEFQETEQLSVTIRKLRPPMDAECEYSQVTMQWQR